MILDPCCLDHVPYEILDKVPTEDDWDYPVPFIRISKKDKQAWLLLDVTDGKATWLPWVGGGKSQIEKIISSCGELIPQSGVIEITNGDGLEAVCEGNKLTIRIKIPIETNIGGTGQTEYNENDLLIGDNTGKLKKLGKGEVGQLLGVKEDGSVGYISGSVEVPIKKFSVSPCGDLAPNSEGQIGLELNDYFTCELNQDRNIAKLGLKNNPSSLIKCTAYLQSNTADVTGDKNVYFLGSTDSAFTVSSQIGDGFYGGNANGNPASFTCREKGDYLFILNVGYAPRSIQGTTTAGYFRVIFNHYNSTNNIIAQYESITRVIGQEFLKHLTENLTKSIIMDINENVKFSVQSYLIGTTRRVSILGRENSLFRTYIDIYKIR